MVHVDSAASTVKITPDIMVSRNSPKPWSDLFYALLFVNRLEKQIAKYQLCNASTQFPANYPQHLVEGRWSLSNEEFGASSLGNTMRKGEFEVLGEKLLDVWSLYVVALLELNNLKDLLLVRNAAQIEP